MKKAILAVSFGTSYDDTRAKTIEAVELDFQETYPDIPVERAITSGMIISSLNNRGIKILNVCEAMEKLLLEGFDEVFVQPTHIIEGDEYDKLREDVLKFKDRFNAIKIGKPLLSALQDKKAVVEIISEQFPLLENEALVLMGHGTGHAVNEVYSEMNSLFHSMGNTSVFVGTVEATPTLDDVIVQLKAGGYTKVILTPFMLVAGDHANNDMAGDWKLVIEQNDISVTPIVKGLGEYPKIRSLYLKHLESVMEE